MILKRYDRTEKGTIFLKKARKWKNARQRMAYLDGTIFFKNRAKQKKNRMERVRMNITRTLFFNFQISKVHNFQLFEI